MEFMNILEKLEILANLIFDNNLFIILTMLLVGIFIFRISRKINNKVLNILALLFEIITFGILFINNKEQLMVIWNEIVDNIFLNFYFPSPFIYLVIFIVSIILFIRANLDIRLSKTYRTITNIYIVTFNLIFILLVNVIVENNINIFLKESIYTNSDVLALLELSTLLFFIYIIVNTMIYFINTITVLVESRRTVKSTYKEHKEVKNVVELDNPEVKPVYNDNPILDINYSFNEMVNKIENKTNEKINLVPELDYIEEVKYSEPVLSELSYLYDSEKELVNNTIEEDELTINDYKLFSKMLESVIKNNNSSNLSRQQLLDINLLDEYTVDEFQKYKKMLTLCLK